MLGSGSGSSHSGSGGARITDKKNIVSTGGENTPPPPLPSTAPPIHRAPLRGRKVGEDDDLCDASDDDNVYEESEDIPIRNENLVQNTDQIYENSEVSFEVRDQIYENADISDSNNEKIPVAIENTNSSVSLDQKEKKNKNPTQFGYKLPGFKKLKNTNEKVPATEGLRKINNATKNSVSLQQRNPIPSPRSVKQTVLILEGATTGETDDGTVEDDGDALYEDAETVFPVT